jgi:hypothetical protein
MREAVLLQLAIGLGGTPTLVQRPRTSPGQAPPAVFGGHPSPKPLPQGEGENFVCTCSTVFLALLVASMLSAQL